MELAASNWGEGHLDFEEQKHVIQQADTVEAKAWIFPLLVHELIKGAMELAA